MTLFDLAGKRALITDPRRGSGWSWPMPGRSLFWTDTDRGESDPAAQRPSAVVARGTAPPFVDRA